jgi:hypothetical protein
MDPLARQVNPGLRPAIDGGVDGLETECGGEQPSRAVEIADPQFRRVKGQRLTRRCRRSLRRRTGQ